MSVEPSKGEPDEPNPPSDSEQLRDEPNVDSDEVIEGPTLSVEGDVSESGPKLGRSHEKTRAGLAWALLLTFAGTVLAVILIVAFGTHMRSHDAAELLKTVLPAETALLGSAVGFYFGTRNRP